MSDLTDAIGTAGEGALVARAIERERGATPAVGDDGHTHEGACLNCGTELAGSHCHTCGQRAHVHRTLSAFFHDLLHGVLHFEGKTWRTIPLLVWKPGKLTREYIEGKRASHVSPIALFLFVVFLSFALFNLLGGPTQVDTADPDLKQGMRSAIASSEQQLEALRTRREANLGNPRVLTDIDAEIADLEAERKVLVELRDRGGGTFLDELASGLELDSSGSNTGRRRASQGLAQAFEQVRENPQLAIYKMQSNAYKFSWMLIPLSMPFVWLLFAFSRRFRGYDHMVFTTYSITFMIALVAVASLFGYFSMGVIGALLLLYAPFHMYRQLRGTYGISRFGAFWRMLALSLFAWMAIGLFVAILGVLAA